MIDDNTSDLEELKIDRQLRKRASIARGAVIDESTNVPRDPRFSSLIKWVWTALGALALIIGVGMYNKLSAMNDSLITVVSKLENQGTQVADLKNDVRDLRNAQNQMQRQVDSLEGKTLRGIQEMKRGN